MSMTEPLSPFGFERDNVAKIEKAQDLSPTETGVIGNGDFTSQLDKLRRLRNFIVSQSIKDAAKDPATGQAAAISLGELNSIRYGEHGRQPSDSEWDELNEKLQYFYSLLSETDRRKFNFKLAVPMLKAIPAALVFGSIF